MTLFTLFICGLAVMLMLHDFKKDTGQFKKQKVIHFLTAIGFLVLYADFIRATPWMLLNFQEVIDKYNVTVGYLESQFSFFLYLGYVIVVIGILYSLYQMVKRIDQGRLRLLKLLPWLWVTELANFYRSWMKGVSLPDESLLPLGVGAVIWGIPLGAIYFCYRSIFMKSFFLGEEIQVVPSEENVLDASLNDNSGD